MIRDRCACVSKWWGAGLTLHFVVGLVSWWVEDVELVLVVSKVKHYDHGHTNQFFRG